MKIVKILLGVGVNCIGDMTASVAYAVLMDDMADIA